MVLRVGACLAVILACAAPADAASCSVEATSILFGSYDVFTPAPTDSIGTIVLDCNGGAKNVAISISRGLGGSYSARRLLKTSDFLYYNVYLDAARDVVWGNGSQGSEMKIIPNPPNRDTTYTMYGRIDAQQDVSAGNYVDYLTVTVNY